MLKLLEIFGFHEVKTVKVWVTSPQWTQVSHFKGCIGLSKTGYVDPFTTAGIPEPIMAMSEPEGPNRLDNRLRDLGFIYEIIVRNSPQFEDTFETVITNGVEYFGRWTIFTSNKNLHLMFEDQAACMKR